MLMKSAERKDWRRMHEERNSDEVARRGQAAKRR
jgi:hypothetical protein